MALIIYTMSVVFHTETTQLAPIVQEFQTEHL